MYVCVYVHKHTHTYDACLYYMMCVCVLYSYICIKDWSLGCFVLWVTLVAQSLRQQ